jgi:hypothetical protein
MAYCDGLRVEECDIRAQADRKEAKRFNNENEEDIGKIFGCRC